MIDTSQWGTDQKGFPVPLAYNLSRLELEELLRLDRVFPRRLAIDRGDPVMERLTTLGMARPVAMESESGYGHYHAGFKLTFKGQAHTDMHYYTLRTQNEDINAAAAARSRKRRRNANAG